MAEPPPIAVASHWDDQVRAEELALDLAKRQSLAEQGGEAPQGSPGQGTSAQASGQATSLTGLTSLASLTLPVAAPMVPVTVQALQGQSSGTSAPRVDPAEHARAVSACFAGIVGTLGPFSNRVAADALKAVAAMYNLRVTSQFAPIPGLPMAGSASQANPKGGSGKKPSAPPAKRAWAKEVDELNKLIAQASKDSGGRLADDHELILRRKALFERKP